MKLGLLPVGIAPDRVSGTVPWLRQLVAGLSPRRPGFAPGSIHVGFVAYDVALGQVFSFEFFSFLQSLSFDRVSPYTCIVWGMNNRPVGGRSSEM
jgi:hypothetical protein